MISYNLSSELNKKVGGFFLPRRGFEFNMINHEKVASKGREEILTKFYRIDEKIA